MITGRIHGVAWTNAVLARIRIQAEAAAGPASQAGGQVVQQEMADRAPRDTGRLVSLIGTEKASLGLGATTRVGSDAPYDRFVQRGTTHMSAQPYGEEAARASIPGVIATMASIFKAAVER